MARPHVVGLTGGIGAGKSTCSAIAREHGYPVFDADAASHEVWKMPEWITELHRNFGNLGDDPRAAVIALVEKSPDVLDTLYEIMAPYLTIKYVEFLDQHMDEPVVIIDSPLLIEKEWDQECDTVVVIMAAPETRWVRVQNRPGMTRAKFDACLKRQATDAERRSVATHLIDGHRPPVHVAECFLDILQQHVPKHGVYPGTFDPITRGHLQALEDSLQVFDKVTALIAVNDAKKTLFLPEERASLMEDAFKTNPRLYAAFLNGRLKIDFDDGMLVQYVKRVKGTHLIRGLRSLTDFDYEQQMNLINSRYAPELRTWFVMADAKFQVVSSTYAKSIVGFGADASWLLTPNVEEAVKAKLNEKV